MESEVDCMTELQQILLDMQKRYPKMRLSDHIKLIYQNEFGCGHLITAPDASLERLEAECKTARPGLNLFEQIGNGYRRLYLKNALELGASPKTMHRIFLATAKKGDGSTDSLRRKLQQLYELCQEGKLPYKAGLCQFYLINYEAAGFPTVHHTPRYKNAYAPSYRVVSEQYARFFELLLRIDRLLNTEKSPLLIAIDGPCASGKTTLAELLQTCYDCNVFHADDFYLRPEQKTPERLREAGGNMDRERLEAEVLRPLSESKDVLYRPYACKTEEVTEGHIVPFKRLNIIEGSYSLHPDLRHYYHVKVTLDITPEHQWNRLKRRESLKSLEMFRDRWIPLEREYAKATDLFSCADLVYPC